MPQNNPSARITVTVKPKSSRREVSVSGGRFIVAVTAPPAEGRANEMCLALVADWLGLAKSRLSLVSGAHHKEKVIEITGMTQAEVDGKLRDAG